MSYSSELYVAVAFVLSCDHSFIFMTLSHYIINFDLVLIVFWRRNPNPRWWV